MKQDQRLARSALHIMEANAVDLHEPALRGILALGFFGETPIDESGSSHHAHNRGNYGLYFTWWDRWCGTEDAQYLRHGDARFAARPDAEAAR